MSTSSSASVPGGVDRRADLGHAARHAGRGLVVDDHHRADRRVARAGPPRRARGRRRGASRPGTHTTSRPSRSAIAAPQRREVAGLEREHAVAGRERVDQRRLPRARARRRVDDDRAVGLEDVPQAVEHLEAELARTSGPRWSIVGASIARRTRSGTLVGPGICRKWRPLRTRVARVAGRRRHAGPLVDPTGRTSERAVRGDARPASRAALGASCAARCAPTPTRAICSPATRACTRASRCSSRSRATPTTSPRRSRLAGRFEVPVVSRAAAARAWPARPPAAGHRARHLAPHERDPRARPRGAARARRPRRRAGGPQPRRARATGSASARTPRRPTGPRSAA